MASLVVYFSRKGENILNFKDVWLDVGNTEVVAKKIAAFTNSDIFQIVPSVPYPDSYDQLARMVYQEQENNIKRDYLNKDSIDVNKYDTVYIGFPIWEKTCPRLIVRFIEENNLAGKVVKLFCTNDEGSFGIAELELKSRIKGADLKPGLAIHGSKINESDDKIKAWLEK